MVITQVGFHLIFVWPIICAVLYYFFKIDKDKHAKIATWNETEVNKLNNIERVQ
ncbi:hypothetical protein [Candidatus Borreliella tachyglossi]|uniref:hypothetical protein n=1 Tax=Candidatus Borreliella tachyglossi TaxID=1964448 RepID=UPI0040436DD5